MLDKATKDWSYEELVKYCVGLELDDIVKGESLKNRVNRICLMTMTWAEEKRKKD